MPPSALVTLFILTSRSFAPFSSVSKSNRSPRRLTFHTRRTPDYHRFAEIESYARSDPFPPCSVSRLGKVKIDRYRFFYLPPRKGSSSKEISFLRTLPSRRSLGVYRYRFVRFELLFDLTRARARERERRRVRFETLKYQAPFVKDNLQTDEQHRATVRFGELDDRSVVSSSAGRAKIIVQASSIKFSFEHSTTERHGEKQRHFSLASREGSDRPSEEKSSRGSTSFTRES